MGQAFEQRSNCPISSVPAISGSLIEDCTISAIPAAIQALEINFFPPPSKNDFGCFCTKIETSLLNIPEPSFTAKWVPETSTDCCEKSLRLTMQGAGCTEPLPEDNNVRYVSPAEFMPQWGFVGAGLIGLQSISDETKECKYDFFLGIPNTLACPSMVVGSTCLRSTSWWSSYSWSSSWHAIGKPKSSEVQSGWTQVMPVFFVGLESQTSCTYAWSPSITWPSHGPLLSSGSFTKSSLTAFVVESAALSYVTDFASPESTVARQITNGDLTFGLQLHVEAGAAWPIEFLINAPEPGSTTLITGGTYLYSPAGLHCETYAGGGDYHTPCEDGQIVSPYVVSGARGDFYFSTGGGIGYRTITQTPRPSLSMIDKHAGFVYETLAVHDWGCVGGQPGYEINLDQDSFWELQIRQNDWIIPAYQSINIYDEISLLRTVSSYVYPNCSCAYQAELFRNYIRNMPQGGKTTHVQLLSSTSWSSSTEYRFFSELEFEYGVLVDFQFSGPEASVHP